MDNLPTLLNSCDREPIHLPGSVQPHGLLLVADRESLRVTHVAGDIEDRLGITDWLGKPIPEILGRDLTERLAEMTQARNDAGYVGQMQTYVGALLDVSTYRRENLVMIELEPASMGSNPVSAALSRLDRAAAEFERAPSLQALCEQAAISFRNLTKFDRVMVYRFVEDGVGYVVAEAKRDDVGTFLNHHFPASDIPQQARALYLRNLTRSIPDVLYEPAPLRPAWTEAEPLDMSISAIRSVSPVHMKYLANMGVGASASISIVTEGTLWGLIACHNETPRLMPFDVRMTAQTLAGTLARQIKTKEEAEGYRQRIRLRSIEDDIVKVLSREGSLDDAIHNHLAEVRQMLGADGVAVIRGAELMTGGTTPSDPAIRELASWLLARPAGPVFQTDRLENIYPPANAFRSLGSGVLAMTLSKEEPRLVIWFRAEQVEVINWAGNPHKEVSHDPNAPLTPRHSFEAWKETVRGRARHWTGPEVEAASRLRGALLEVQQTRRVKDLNRRLTEILAEKDLVLDQKDFLIGEVNHRVQNSLQLVGSFLHLQARGSDSPELKGALEEARRRLTAVALVHRRLYRGDHVQLVDASRYCEELITDMISSLGSAWEPYFTLDLAPVMIPTSHAVSLGLVLTELIININKYAYDGDAGPVEVRLTTTRNDLHLTVADHGRGKISSRQGFGSRMMNSLVGQLGGNISFIDNYPGLRAELVAPVKAPAVAS